MKVELGVRVVEVITGIVAPTAGDVPVNVMVELGVRVVEEENGLKALDGDTTVVDEVVVGDV